MTRFTFGAALAALSLAVPAAAPAQRLSPAIIAVVDVQRVSRECTACRAAATQLQQQMQQIEQRAQQLRGSLEPEGRSIQQAVAALAGRQPDAALNKRIQAYTAKENSARQELGQRQNVIQSTEANVNRQIQQRLMPIINQVMQTRGATLVVSRGAALSFSPSIDVTSDVLAQLNRALPSVTVAPLPAQQQQPQGR